jgi:hypothetical protein
MPDANTTTLDRSVDFVDPIDVVDPIDLLGPADGRRPTDVVARDDRGWVTSGPIKSIDEVAAMIIGDARRNAARYVRENRVGQSGE